MTQDFIPGESYVNLRHARYITLPEGASNSYRRASRDFAQQVATERGEGLIMELGSSSTRYYSSDTVPLQQVAIFLPTSYKGTPTYLETIPEDQDWETERDKETRAWLIEQTTSRELIVQRILEEHQPDRAVFDVFSAAKIGHCTGCLYEGEIEPHQAELIVQALWNPQVMVASP